ncbi:glycosyltransferase [Lyngbya aestuarii]|uniref:glycosyltransferase n=1 Tax=Lyngbya aestuarii TaxID=118322 RepID=UPI00403DEEEE
MGSIEQLADFGVVQPLSHAKANCDLNIPTSTYAQPPIPVFKQSTLNFRKLRIVLYSHDTMGLGHNRRNMLIAQTLACSPIQTDILMINGMQEASNFPTPPGVDCLTLPALYKGTDGQYRSRRLDISLGDIIALRAKVIQSTVEAFAPDVLIVDNVPRGAVRELDPTLEYLRTQGHTRCILGLRDVLDEPTAVRRDWERAAHEDAIRNYYDAVWVYGDPRVYDLAREYNFAHDVVAKFRYTGYLDQRLRLQFVDVESAEIMTKLQLPPGELVLCLVGGGQDGAFLAEAFAQAELPPNTNGVILTGPFMPAEVRQNLHDVAAKQPRLKVLEFVAEPTLLLNQADRVIAMGGYNTTCEILSFEKPALIVPRVQPRREQLIRAKRLATLGLLDLLHPDEINPRTLTEWLAKDGAAPQIPECVDLNGLVRLPQLLEEVLATTHD